MKLNDCTLALEAVRADMERGIGDALSGLAGARSRITLTEREVERYATAHAKLLHRLDVRGDVTQNEVLTTARRLLQARLSHIGATIENKQTEGRLLATEGVLAAVYGERVAATSFERKRVAALAALLHYFAPSRD